MTMLENASTDVRTWRTMPSVIAECQAGACGWFRDVGGTADSDNVRAAAKRHAQQTGHTVRVERTITTYIEARS